MVAVTIRRLIVNPPGRDLAGEAVVLHNNGEADVDLTGWRLTDTLFHPEHRTTFIFPTFTLVSGSSVAIHSGAGTNDGQNLFWGRQGPVWNNTGDKAVLLDNDGFEVTTLSWDGRPLEGRIIDTDLIAAELAAAVSDPPTSSVNWTTTGPSGGEIFWQEFGSTQVAFHIGFPDSLPSDAPVPENRIILVTQSILTKYIDLGGPKTLGRPLTSRRLVPVREPGREAHRQDFEGGTIYRSAQTRAHLVKGAIRDKYLSDEVGGSSGSMGLPTSDEVRETTGLHYCEFERGSIWFTPQDGIQAIFGLVIEFVGFHCFGRQQGIGRDDVYFEVDATPLDRSLDLAVADHDGTWATVLPTAGHPTYKDISSGTTFPDTVTVYIGRAAPMHIKVHLWEHDSGDPNALREEIKTAVAAAGAVVATFVPAASAVAMNPDVQATLTSIINGVAGTGDDFIGRGEFKLASRQEIMTMLRSAPNLEFGVPVHRKVFLTDGDASYDAYFAVRRMSPT